MYRRLQIYEVAGNISQFMCINDLKIFIKNQEKSENLIQTIKIHSQDSAMKFEILSVADSKRMKTGGEKEN